MPGMTKSKIGYVNEQVPWSYGWNPGGASCSANCPDCWSRANVKRWTSDGKYAGCEKCASNVVHLHPERLEQPAKTKKPGVVLCNFTCDVNDPARPWAHRKLIFEAMEEAPWHTYVTLTKNADQMRADANTSGQGHRMRDNLYRGLTIPDQRAADEKLPVFLPIPGKLWLSLEPLGSSLDFACRDLAKACYPPPHNHCMDGNCTNKSSALCGVIVGHNNTFGQPGTDTLEHIRSVVKQCKAARVAVYVKQLWREDYNAKTDKHYWRLLRASHVDKRGWHDERSLFPADLQVWELPWTQPEASK